MGRKEGNILINDALDTFLFMVYGVRHIVKDLSDRMNEWMFNDTPAQKQIGYWEGRK